MKIFELLLGLAAMAVMSLIFYWIGYLTELFWLKEEEHDHAPFMILWMLGLVITAIIVAIPLLAYLIGEELIKYFIS